MNKEVTLARWERGKDFWNAWANEMLARRTEMEKARTWGTKRDEFDREESANDATDAWIRAAAADFSDRTFDEAPDFSDVVFPGQATFDRAIFANRNSVPFGGATFIGKAGFNGAIFTGNADFGSATFTENADFDSALFSGEAAFSSTFNGKACFNRTKFIKDAWFGQAKFSSDAWFGNAEFGETAFFCSATFCEEGRFVNATFGGDALFNDTQFRKDVEFRNAAFSKDAWFNGVEFWRRADFAQSLFEGYSGFAGVVFKKQADFAATQGKSGFTLAGARFEEVPDFIQAHFAEAPRLDNVQLRRGKGVSDLASRYRALKRLAIQAHDHAREQEYFAGELKALRGHPDRLFPNPLNWFRRDEDGRRQRAWPGGTRYWFGLIYQGLSDFGRSMLRPLVWWALALMCFDFGYLDRHFERAAELGQGYAGGVGGWLWASLAQPLVERFPRLAELLPTPAAVASPACLVGPGEPWSAALGLSIRKALPFAGVGSTEKLNQIYACLYGIHGASVPAGELPARFTPVIPDAVDYLGIVQLLLSLLLLFLFLLAVRNHFRIR